MNEPKKTKLGVQLIVFYTWLSAIVCGFFTLIIAFIIVQDPGANGIGVGILAFIILGSLTYLFGKLANMTGRMESKAWWWQMIISAFGVFSLNPISLVIIIYLWLTRASFGIMSCPTTKKEEKEEEA